MQVANTLAYYDTPIITAVNIFIGQTPRVFVPRNSLWSSLMFASKARAHPSEALSGAPFLGKLLALTANIRLGR
jgi:hypothetical protein